MPADPLTSQQFDRMMSGLLPVIAGERSLAVAVSGGGDSMALAALLADWCAARGVGLLALTVDHALRPESAKEARDVARWMKNQGIKHRILRWDGAKPKTRIQETAREARYDLLGQACRKAKIKLLCVAHHGDDQMETILFRLAKGSGLDGLSGMVPIHRLDEAGVTLLRPLLETSHDSLLATCRARHIPWTEDPSNEKTDYARVRMRGARAVLEREGFTLDRLITAARRFDRASRALVQLSEKEYKNCVLSKETKRIEINFFNLKSQPEELVFRILKMAIVDVTEGRGPVIRLQRLEALVTRILTDPSFRGATLGGAMLRLYPARANGDGLLVIMPEAFGSP